MLRQSMFLAVLLALVAAPGAVNAQEKNTKTDKKMTEAEADSIKREIMVIETTMGTIEVAMFRADAPKTVENFEQLAAKGYYDGIIFHRVIDKFMIQGGDPTGTGMGGESIYGKGFENEISPKLKFDRPGLLAMANTGRPNTNGSQFFITIVPTDWLNGKHTIFGEVVAGMDVVNAIGKVAVAKGDKPVKDVGMNHVYLKGFKKKVGG
ncbi:MAG TPA: peptidylprolyl isomerase, partial [Bacteroidota bacterium]|nr:peptidylprolyl isomerase [Bacteroidota bacterium]